MGSELVARDCSSGRTRPIRHSRLGAGRTRARDRLGAGAPRSGRGVRCRTEGRGVATERREQNSEAGRRIIIDFMI